MFICYLTIYHGDLLPPFYIGSTSLINIKNGYKGSVVSKKYSKIFKQEIKNNKDLFEVLIISKHKTRKEAMIAELEIQKKLNAVKSEPFFNESYASIDRMFGRNVKGKNNPMYGKKHSEETKKKIAIKATGRKVSEETKQKHRDVIVSEETRRKMANTRRGKKLTEEQKHKMSIARKGKKLTEEHKKNISDAHLGKKFTEEHKKNISRGAKKRKPVSEETRKKISIAKKGKKEKSFLSSGE